MRVHSSVSIESYASLIRCASGAPFESLSSTGRGAYETPSRPCPGRPRAGCRRCALMRPTCASPGAHTGHQRDTCGTGSDPRGPHWSTYGVQLASRLCLLRGATGTPTQTSPPMAPKATRRRHHWSARETPEGRAQDSESPTGISRRPVCVPVASGVCHGGTPQRHKRDAVSRLFHGAVKRAVPPVEARRRTRQGSSRAPTETDQHRRRRATGTVLAQRWCDGRYRAVIGPSWSRRGEQRGQGWNPALRECARSNWPRMRG